MRWQRARNLLGAVGRKWRVAALLVLLSLLLGPLFIFRATARHPAPTLRLLLPVVPVAPVTRADLYNEVTIPAEFRPFSEVDLHAKVAGFVQDITVDIGDEVKAGQLLATLEVPELQDELDRANAAQRRAEADYHEAHLGYTRLLGAVRDTPNLIAQQELDVAEAKDHTAEAAIAAAKAEADKYRTMLAYTKITAPFPGVVTRRYADPGSLIQAGTTSQSQTLPVVRLSDNYHLRLDFPVPVKFVKDIQLGDPVDVEVVWLGKTFVGKISRFSQKVDEATRSMVTEIEVPNPKLELVPGMYANVFLRVHRRPGVLTIPTEAVSSGKNPTVLVIDRGDQVEERPVQLGLETPTRYEVLQGLHEGERVILGSRSEIHAGEKVEPKLQGTLAQQ